MLKKTLLFFIAILHPLGINAHDFFNVTYHTCYDGDSGAKMKDWCR